MSRSNGNQITRLKRLEMALAPVPDELPFITMAPEDWAIFTDETVHPGERILIAERYGMVPFQRYKIYVDFLGPDEWDDD